MAGALTPARAEMTSGGVAAWFVVAAIGIVVCVFLSGLGRSAEAADWQCSATDCYPLDPDDALLVDIRFPRKGNPGHGWRKLPPNRWHLIDLGVTDDAVGATLRIRLSISDGLSTARGDDLGVAVRYPGSHVDHEGREHNGLSCKARVEGRSEGGRAENGVRDDCMVMVATMGRWIELRWTVNGIATTMTKARKGRSAAGGLVVWLAHWHRSIDPPELVITSIDRSVSTD